MGYIIGLDKLKAQFQPNVTDVNIVFKAIFISR